MERISHGSARDCLMSGLEGLGRKSWASANDHTMRSDHHVKKKGSGRLALCAAELSNPSKADSRDWLQILEKQILLADIDQQDRHPWKTFWDVSRFAFLLQLEVLIACWFLWFVLIGKSEITSNSLENATHVHNFSQTFIFYAKYQTSQPGSVLKSCGNLEKSFASLRILSSAVVSESVHWLIKLQIP